MRYVPSSLSLATVALCAWLQAPALAQAPLEPLATRADVLAHARETLAATSEPPRRSSLDRGLSWYDNQYLLTKIAGGWNGVHPAGGAFPAGAGLKFGVGFDRQLTPADADPALPNRMAVAARAAYSSRGYARLSAGVEARNIGGTPFDVTGFGQYYEFPQEDFFGFGMNSLEANRANYLLDAIEAGGAVAWRPARFTLDAHLSFLNARIGRGTDSRFDSVEDRFDPGAIPGLGTETNFVKARASAGFDWRDNPLLPRSGGRYTLEVTRFDDRDLGRFDFWRADLSLHQYVPLPNRYRTLALRAEAAFTDASAGQSVPFYLQPTLGGANDLRGFREFRFRDQNSVLVGAEYRWEAWWALDGALFVDAGAVAPTRKAFALRDAEVSYGIGFRFHSNRAFVGRLDLAFSREGFIPLLRFDHVF